MRTFSRAANYKLAHSSSSRLINHQVSLNRRCIATRFRIQAEAAEAPPVHRPPPPAITLTDAALHHLKKLKADNRGDTELVLRMGVKSGGCNGMSYIMDFEKDIRPDDAIMEYEGGFKLVTDPKSLLYLFGLQLDYSAELIGGGFSFKNPSAESSCGCGKSFSI